ncbi:MAB_1171c family putative transporter [Rhodococcus opacus]|uniref:MAB_1171c family putative transporter n=1 Tax=Rhodococcus opacus TaxID=37919 RepID=UPI0002A37DF4|nr:MAB_1171c family putative transporter [Rhodococcus opacus]ELB92474.1 hypothetical protein Rwratislav_13913 [Rhodococcus wratislaviensis IFP 2016]MDX5962866.1 MAB_1171c family putative transporter [Rhodococcus opacus]
MTSTLPTAIEWPMMAILLIVALLRALFLHSRLDQRMTTTLFFWGCVALLRDPHVQDRLAEHLVDPSVIRQATHMSAMLASAAIIGAAAIWAAPAERSTTSPASAWHRFETQSIVYTVVFIMGLALFPLSSPARTAGQSLEDHGGWQLVAYMIVYAAPTMAAMGAVGLLVLEAARESRSMLVRIGATLATFTCVISLIDSTTRIINACLLAGNHHNAFTTWRSESNDVMFLPEVTVIALVLAAPLVNRLAARLGIDQSSRLVRRLMPMWRDLSVAMPMLVLDQRPDRPDDLAQRMSIEIWDTLIRLRDYLPPRLIPARTPDLSQIRERDRVGVTAALAVQEAIDAYRAGAPAAPLSASPSDLNRLDLEELARGWELAPRMFRGTTEDPTNMEGLGRLGLSEPHG